MPRAKRVNHRYFDVLTPSSAWVLGFWTADGCVYKKRNTFVVSFAQSDKCLLELVKNEMESEHKIGSSAKQSGMTLQFCSKHMNDSLCRIFGVESMCRKSTTVRWPVGLPEHLFWHFMRGWIDGDGCFRFSNGQPRLIITSGSFDLLNTAKQRVEDRTGIALSIRVRSHSNYNMDCCGVNAKIMVEHLYANAELWSSRKKEKADEIAGWRSRRRLLNLSERTVKLYPNLIRDSLLHGQCSGKSGYIGVEKIGKGWGARLHPHGRIGVFETAEGAARARDRAAIERYGPCAVLNFA